MQTTDLRNTIIDGYMYSFTSIDGKEVFTNAICTREYYDQQVNAGDSPEDIIETISIHAESGLIKLNKHQQ